MKERAKRETLLAIVAATADLQKSIGIVEAGDNVAMIKGHIDKLEKLAKGLKDHQAQTGCSDDALLEYARKDLADFMTVFQSLAACSFAMFEDVIPVTEHDANEVLARVRMNCNPEVRRATLEATQGKEVADLFDAFDAFARAKKKKEEPAPSSAGSLFWRQSGKKKLVN